MGLCGHLAKLRDGVAVRAGQLVAVEFEVADDQVVERLLVHERLHGTAAVVGDLLAGKCGGVVAVRAREALVHLWREAGGLGVERAVHVAGLRVELEVVDAFRMKRCALVLGRDVRAEKSDVRDLRVDVGNEHVESGGIARVVVGQADESLVDRRAVVVFQQRGRGVGARHGAGQGRPRRRGDSARAAVAKRAVGHDLGHAVFGDRVHELGVALPLGGLVAVVPRDERGHGKRGDDRHDGEHHDDLDEGEAPLCGCACARHQAPPPRVSTLTVWVESTAPCALVTVVVTCVVALPAAASPAANVTLTQSPST